MMSQKAQKVLEISEMDNLTMMKEEQLTAEEILFQAYLDIANEGGFGETELLCNGDIVGDNFDFPVYFQYSPAVGNYLKGENKQRAKKSNQRHWNIRFRDENGFLNEPTIVSQKKFESLLRQATHNLGVLLGALRGFGGELSLIKMKYQ